MNQRESLLVYAVTGILVILVAGAVFFGGGETLAAGDSEKQAAATGPVDPAALLSDSNLPVDDQDAPVDDDSARPEDDQPDVLSDAELLDLELRRALGPFETIDYGVQRRWRRVTVRQGDILDRLVLRWTGNTELMDEVLAMNEGLSRNSTLRIGQTLTMPWVAPEVLLARARNMSTANVPLRRSAADLSNPDSRALSADELLGDRSSAETPNGGGDQSAPGPAPAAAATTYEVKSGESLWTIAAKKVGRGKADAYVKRIVAENSSISDPSRVRAGQRIKLPPVE